MKLGSIGSRTRRSVPSWVVCAFAWSMLAAGQQVEHLDPLFVRADPPTVRLAMRLADQGFDGLSKAPSVPAKQSRFVQLNPQALMHWASVGVNQSWLCRLNLFPGSEFVAELVARSGGGNAQTYYGAIEGEMGGQILLVRSGDVLAASV